MKRICSRFAIAILMSLSLTACQQDKDASSSITSKETALEHAKKHADPNYICPMHPQITQKKPGSCPICGMDLVKSKPAPASNSENTVKQEEDGLPVVQIRADIAQNMGIRKNKAEIKGLSRQIKTIGKITLNDNRLENVHMQSNGWIKKVQVKSQGERVNEGDLLFEYYSPELITEQQNYLTLLHNVENGWSWDQSNRQQLADARQRLQLMGLSPAVIKVIERTRTVQDNLPVYADRSGHVVAIGIRDDQYVTPETELYKIADLSSVWVIVDIFEQQAGWVKKGNKATMHIESKPDQFWEGTVDFIYPQLNPETRTLKVRVKFDNPEGELKPNMFANITLFSPERRVVTVPEEAIIPTGKDTARVVRVVLRDQYKPVEIKTGIQVNGYVEVIEGLKENDIVIVSGQFLLDSESNLQASLRRMSNGE